MYAIIKTGGKQYRVVPGQNLKIETLNSAVGDEIVFEEVLMINSGDNALHVGAPFVKGAQVKAEVIQQGRGKKIEIIKFRRRKHHMKRMGHRQNFTEVKITNIHTAHKS